MKLQRKENSKQGQSKSAEPRAKAKTQSLHEFVEQRFWGQPVSIQDGFRAFYSRNAGKYERDFELALLDFTSQR